MVEGLNVLRHFNRSASSFYNYLYQAVDIKVIIAGFIVINTLTGGAAYIRVFIFY